jgi:N-acetylmuramoyl-L-alanine amidase
MAAFQASPSASATPANLPSPQTSVSPQKPAVPEFFVMIDPSHGGDDRGTVFPGKIQEKDLTLVFARELRKQLEERGIHARLLREGDANLSLERRAEITNQERAGIYIAVHASPPGRGVRVYSAAFPSPATPALQNFVSWDVAQAPFLERSRATARAVSDELRKSDIPVNLLAAPLRPLNNVVAPAISLEWAPAQDELKPQQATKAVAKLTSAVATAIADIRGGSGARP